MLELALLAACFWGVAWSLNGLAIESADRSLLYLLSIIETNRRAMK
jgi:hypothetical protein